MTKPLLQKKGVSLQKNSASQQTLESNLSNSVLAGKEFMLKTIFFTLSVVLSNFILAQEDNTALVYDVTQKYITAFYESKPELLIETLHPELVKRTIKDYSGTNEFVVTSGKTEMVELSKIFNLRGTYSADSRADITVLAVGERIATVKLVAEKWTDYLQLVKIDGSWRIINVLWDMNNK